MNSFRIWDRVNECWLTEKDKVFVNSNGELIKVGAFGRIKTLNKQRYIVHKDVDVTDKNENYIYEGDFVDVDMVLTGKYKGKHIKTVCTIAYVPDALTFALLDVSTEKVYPFRNNMVLEVIGNVFDTPEIVEELNPRLASQVKQLRTFTDLEGINDVDDDNNVDTDSEVSADEK